MKCSNLIKTKISDTIKYVCSEVIVSIKLPYTIRAIKLTFQAAIDHDFIRKMYVNACKSTHL